VHSFQTALGVLGGLLVVGALLSGIARRSFLSLTALFVLAGFALGHDGLDVLHFDPRSSFTDELAVVALIVILFRDGLEVDAEMLQTAWAMPLRKLALGMPITAGIVAVTTHLVTDLDWTQSFLVGALLSPTDPILSSSVVTNPRVPRLVRHSLNLESGLNDGLALPPILAFSAALDVNEHSFNWLTYLLQDVGIGLLYGVVTALVASVLLPRGGGLDGGIPAHQRSLYALGVAFGTYALTVAPPHGNGFIAVFVCAIVLGIRRPDLRHYFNQRAEDLVEIVKLGVFVLFGSLLTVHGLFTDGWAAVAVVAVTLLVARPVAIAVSLAGTGLGNDAKAFMAWFGPKGVATMTFALLVLSREIPGNERIFNLCALAVFTSILAHGLTDVPGAEWLARRSELRRGGAPAPARWETSRPPGSDAPGGT
jgi:NhaP-type Na+/H+ or K+/H+ antiporter